MTSASRIISLCISLLILSTASAIGQTLTTIFDEDPLSAAFRDASWGTFSGAGEYLKLAGGSGDKAPITTAVKFSGNQSILLEAKHVTGGSWNLFIASNAWASRDFSLYDTLIFYINTPDSLAASELPLLGLESENADSKSATVNLATYVMLDSSSATWHRCAIPFTAFQPYGNFLLSKFKTVRFINNGTNPAVRTLWIDNISALSNKTINTLLPAITEERLLDTLQYTAFRYFWEQANPLNGLVKDRSTTNSGASIAATGFGVSAICIAIDRGWVTRASGRARVQAIINTFHDGPQGTGGSGTIGYKGWFYHFLDMNTATRAGSSELSTIDTGLLLAGLIHAREYFDGQDAVETEMRQKVDAIQSRIDWQWILNGNIIRHGWSPESGMIPWGWGGYSEAMILVVLGLGSPTAPIPVSSWTTWTSTYPWITYAGYSHVGFAALFGHQYSQSWIDFRNIKDAYMTAKGIDYFENSRRATLANRAFCIANPGGYKGYSDSLWGLTACDGPTGYKARGGPNGIDDGTIAPTAAISSMPFTPTESKKFARVIYEKFGTNLFGPYGFRDAFNEHFAWFGTDYIGIDQGPIIMMIENYRTGKVWNAFMKNQTIRNGLVRAGFSGVVSVPSADAPVPGEDYLQQNYPNPFNPVTTISYSLRTSGPVILSVYNTLGQRVAILVDQEQSAGEHSVPFDASELSSGIYYYRLQSERFTAAGMMTLVK